MRLGFFAGFLIGAALASLLGEKRVAEAPGDGASVVVIPAGNGAKPEATGVVDKLKQQANQALEAARQASDEKQAAMLREFYESTHPKT